MKFFLALALMLGLSPPPRANADEVSAKQLVDHARSTYGAAARADTLADSADRAVKAAQKSVNQLDGKPVDQRNLQGVLNTLKQVLRMAVGCFTEANSAFLISPSSAHLKFSSHHAVANKS